MRLSVSSTQYTMKCWNCSSVLVLSGSYLKHNSEFPSLNGVLFRFAGGGGGCKGSRASKAVLARLNNWPAAVTCVLTNLLRRLNNWPAALTCVLTNLLMRINNRLATFC